MTVLEKKAATGVDTKTIGRYLGVAVVAVAIGVGVGLGADRLASGDEVNPASIATLRAAEYADYMQNQWIAQVNATKNADLVARFAGQHAAQMAQIQAQRAQDMADHLAGQFAARLNAINEQRAEDMSTFKYGWEGEADS
ncbi:MAG TPA: hypothetical protein VGA97_02035 [Acidimicrobiia bacterium]